MPEMKTVAIGGLLIECNHLGGMPADLEAFLADELRFGDEIFENTGGVSAGMVEALRGGHNGDTSPTIRPLMMASCCSRGPVTGECYEYLKGQLLTRLSKAMPVDGVLLALHGAASAETVGDVDGDMLEAVRMLVGSHVPVVATLDLHADVTERMVRNTDALLA